jgi:hypothetical protein
MATSNAIRAGRAFVELFADTSKLDRALKQVGRKFSAFGTMLSGWGKAMAGAGAAIIAPMLIATKLTGEMGEKFGNMAQRTGASVEALTGLAYVASQTGTSIETVENGIRKMQKSLEDAAGGSKEASDALAELGMSAQDLQGLSPDEQFKKLGDAIGKLPSPSQRAAVAMKIFGKTGTELLPMFAQGADGINGLIDRAKELGLVLSGQDIAAAGAFNDKMDEMWQVVRAAGFAIGSALLPVLTTTINVVEKALAIVINWVKAHKEAVVWTLAVGAGLLALGAAFYVAGTAIVFAVSVIGAVGSALATVWAAITAIGGAIAAVLTSPLLLAIGVVAALGAAFVWVSGAGGKAMAWLGSKFGELKDMAMEAFQGIANALLAGDIELAAKIVWVILRMAWETGIHWLEGLWLGFKLDFVKAAYGMYFGAQAAFELLTHWLTVAWVETIAALQSGWIAFTSWYHRTVEGLANWLAKKWVDIQATFDDTIDVNFQKNYIDQQSDFEEKKIKADEKTAKAKIDADRQAQLKGEQADHEANMAGVGKAYEDAIAAAQAKYDASKNGDDTELKNLKSQYAALLQQAKNAKRSDSGALGSAGAPPSVDDFQDRLKSAGKTVGTFSAAAAQGMFGGSTQDHIKRTAEATAEMVRLMKKGKERRAVVLVD